MIAETCPWARPPGCDAVRRQDHAPYEVQLPCGKPISRLLA